MENPNVTTKETIKQMFVSGQVLTSCDTSAKYQTADLRKYVSMLRREFLKEAKGFFIKDEWVKSDNNKHFKKYWLEREEQAMPGQQQFKFGT